MARFALFAVAALANAGSEFEGALALKLKMTSTDQADVADAASTANAYVDVLKLITNVSSGFFAVAEVTSYTTIANRDQARPRAPTPTYPFLVGALTDSESRVEWDAVMKSNNIHLQTDSIAESPGTWCFRAGLKGAKLLTSWYDHEIVR